MKQKSFNKKLVLNKTTVANLKLEEMGAAKAGIYYTAMEWTCVSWCGCTTQYWYLCPTDWRFDDDCLPPID